MKIASWAPLACVAAAAVSNAQAEGYSAAAAFTSDQVLRGISLSNGAASVSLDGNLRSDTGWAAGLGIATLGRDADGQRSLLTASVGRGWQLDDDWSSSLGVAHYAYPGGAERHAFDYDELSASFGWRGQVMASVALSPRGTRRDSGSNNNSIDGGSLKHGRTAAYELSLHQRLAGSLVLDAGIGWRDLRAIRGAGYPYGSVALGYGVGPVQWVGSFITSRAAQRGLAAAGAAGDRWVMTVVWDF